MPNFVVAVIITQKYHLAYMEDCFRAANAACYNGTMKSRKAFTVLELLLCIAFVGILTALFFIQKNTVEAMDRDDDRKTAINAMYYALEEGYYAENGYYPEKIDSADVLPWIDPNLFTDPYGANIWTNGGDYSYEASNCKDGRCKEYTLRATMEKEDDYVKTNRR